MASGTRTTARTEASGRASGAGLFAGVLLVMVGIFQAVAGLAAIIEDRFYVVTTNYAYALDVTRWGWIHLGVGIVVAAAGFGVIFGARLWARALGIVVATLSAIANFFFIPYYPWWSLLIIALDVFVIWALCVQGRDATQIPRAETPAGERERVRH